LFIIGLVFAVVLIPYFYIENSKTFVFGGADWRLEDYDSFGYYHGRFLSLTNKSLVYNIYLRDDPRKNNVPTSGTFNEFGYGVLISTAPEFDLCRGDASRVMVDLGSFMNVGFGAGPLGSGSTNEEIANASSRVFANCDNLKDNTVIIVKIGDNFVEQDENNLNCYTISVGDCDDASSVEKFMLKTIADIKGIK